MNGVIKRLQSEKGFGFIKPDGAHGDGDYFFHSSSVSGASSRTFEELREGDRVEFADDSGAKGPRAKDVRAL